MIDKLGLFISNKFLNFPKDASEFGYKADVLNGWVHFLMLILFVFWGILFIYIILKFSSTNNPKASYSGMKGKFSKYAEGGVVLFEIFLLFALAIPGYYDLKFAELEKASLAIIDLKVLSDELNQICPSAASSVGLVVTVLTALPCNSLYVAIINSY